MDDDTSTQGGRLPDTQINSDDTAAAAGALMDRKNPATGHTKASAVPISLDPRSGDTASDETDMEKARNVDKVSKLTADDKLLRHVRPPGFSTQCTQSVELQRSHSAVDTLPFDPSTITKKDLKGVGYGLVGIVLHIKDTNIVIKQFAPNAESFRDSEKRIYEHLQSQAKGHPNILKYYGTVTEYELFRRGLLFEFHPRGTLEKSLGKLDTIGITQAERSRWPQQAASAIAYIHSLYITHCDLGVHNFLIGDDGRLILCDFAGSGMKGLKSTVGASSRYSHPDSYGINYEMGPEDDIFALGTVFYELYFAKRLFDDQTSGEIRRKLRDQQYPDLSAMSLPLRNVIKKCWLRHGYTANEALADLDMLDTPE